MIRFSLTPVNHLSPATRDRTRSLHCCSPHSAVMMKPMNLGFSEMVFIFLLALIIFGPKKLPEIGRQIGKALNECKRASNEFKAQIENEITNLDVANTRAELEK